MTTRVKICGLSTRETVEAAIGAGADYLGFNFIARSSRYVSCETASTLAADMPSTVAKVALTLDADNETLDAVVAALDPDILQLHGAETPARLMELKSRYGLPLMKAIGISEPGDPESADIYRDSADLLLFERQTT